MTIWFTSDTHWGHKNILFYCPMRAKFWGTPEIADLAEKYSKKLVSREELREKLYKLQYQLEGSVQNMNEGLIRNWNSKVMPGDDVYHLGDFMMGSSQHWESILKRLNGNIHMIKGNHDHKFVKQTYVCDRVVWIEKDYELRVEDPDIRKGKQRIVLHHFPKLVWEDGHKDTWHLHGHCHGSVDHVNRATTRLDVGVDAEYSDYFPMSYEQVKEVMKTRTYSPVDHHNDSEM